MITRDGVREAGSEQFQKALRQDSVHEIHPGWQSLRRMTGVIGSEMNCIPQCIVIAIILQEITEVKEEDISENHRR